MRNCRIASMTACRLSLGAAQQPSLPLRQAKVSAQHHMHREHQCKRQQRDHGDTSKHKYSLARFLEWEQTQECCWPRVTGILKTRSWIVVVNRRMWTSSDSRLTRLITAHSFCEVESDSRLSLCERSGHAIGSRSKQRQQFWWYRGALPTRLNELSCPP